MLSRGDRTVFHFNTLYVQSVRSVFIGLLITMGVMRTAAQLQHYYFHSELFGMEDGMEHGVIGDFQIDKNGLLWVQTINNLQLFDGKNFISMNDQIPSERIRGTFSFGISSELFFLNDRDLVRLNTDNSFQGKIKFSPCLYILTAVKSIFFLKILPSSLFPIQMTVCIKLINARCLSTRHTIFLKDRFIPTGFVMCIEPPLLPPPSCISATHDNV